MLDTTRQELEAQAAVARECVTSILEDVRRDRVVQQALRDRPLLLAGAGDSGLVGRAVAFLFRDSGTSAVTPDSFWLPVYDGVGAMVCQSISGLTASTLGMARAAKERGWPVLSITSEPNGALPNFADHAFEMPIPRYVPDAKVPGTITFGVALAVTFSLVAFESESDPTAAGQQIESMIDQSTAIARASLPTSLSFDFRPNISIIHGAVDVPALYLQAKLAEGLRIAAPVSTAEHWLHTIKHAIDDRSTVVVIGSDSIAAELLSVIKVETSKRGGCLISDRPSRPRGTGQIVMRSWDSNIKDTFGQVAFAQQMLFQALHQSDGKLPYQLDRLHLAQVRPSPMSYTFVQDR